MKWTKKDGRSVCIRFQFRDSFTGNIIFELPMQYDKLKAASGFYSKLKNRIEKSPHFNALKRETTRTHFLIPINRTYAGHEKANTGFKVLRKGTLFAL